MPRHLTEFVGTFFLVLTVGFVVTAPISPLGPIAIGAILMVMVYAGGHISGAHYNPAVSLAVFMRGKLKPADVGPYMAAQLLGAVAAALAVRGMTGATFVPAPAADASTIAVLLAEFLFTFALALVVLNTATATETEGNAYFGLAIGFTVAAGAIAAGGLSGGAFNPAVGLGPAVVHVMNGGSIAHVWIYLLAPLAGGAAAALVFNLQHPTGDKRPAIPAD